VKVNTALKIGILSSLSLISIVALGIWLYKSCLNNTHKRYYPRNLRNLQSLSRRLNVRLTAITAPISMKSGKHQISLKPADTKYLNFYIPKFIAELLKYPPEVISDIGLKEVMIGSSLFLDQHACGGMQSKYLHMLFFDCRYVSLDQWTRAIIHHEMFHLIDWKDGVIKQDAEWEKLNSSEFSYGSGGWSMHSESNGTATLLDSNLHGFLNRYSMSGLEEAKQKYLPT